MANKVTYDEMSHTCMNVPFTPYSQIPDIQGYETMLSKILRLIKN